MLFFPYETFYLAWFYAFLYFRGIELLFVHNRVEGLRACFRGKIWTFWMSETLVFGILLGCLDYYKCCHCKILRIFLVTPPLNPLCFFTPLSLPLKPHFFHDPPPPQNIMWTFPNKGVSCSDNFTFIALTRFILSYNNVVEPICVWELCWEALFEVSQAIFRSMSGCKGKKLPKPFIGRAQFRGLLSQMQYACISFQRPGLLEFRHE